MTGFEPRTSGIGSNLSTNWATTTAKALLYIRRLQQIRIVIRWLGYFSIFVHFQQTNVNKKIAIDGTDVCQILNRPYQKLPKHFYNFAKVTKFLQIWSHW